MSRTRLIALFALVVFCGYACVAFAAKPVDVNTLLAKYEKGDKATLGTLYNAGVPVIPDLNTAMQSKESQKWIQRIGAAQVAGELKNSKSLAGLTSMLDNGNDAEKAVALRAIANIGGDQAKTIINARINKLTGKVQRLAKKTLANLNKGISSGKSALTTKTSKITVPPGYYVYGNEALACPQTDSPTTAVLGHPEAVDSAPPTGIPVASQTPPVETPEQSNANRIVYVNFYYSIPEYVWGNVKINFDATRLECVSIEEHPETYGFWTWWTPATNMPVYGADGEYYKYGSSLNNDLHGSIWAKTWAPAYGTYPVGSINNATGNIYIFASNFTYTLPDPDNLYAPLRLGFKVKNGVTIPQDGLQVTFNTHWNSDTAYDWHDDKMTGHAYSQVVIKERKAVKPWQVVTDVTNNILTLTDPLPYQISTDPNLPGKFACVAGAVPLVPPVNPLDNSVIKDAHTLSAMLTFAQGQNVTVSIPAGMGVGCEPAFNAQVYVYSVFFNKADGTVSTEFPPVLEGLVSPTQSSLVVNWIAPPTVDENGNTVDLEVKYLAIVMSSNIIEKDFKLQATVGATPGADLPVPFGPADATFNLNSTNIIEGYQYASNSTVLGFSYTSGNNLYDRQVTGLGNHGGKMEIADLNYTPTVNLKLYKEGVTTFIPGRAKADATTATINFGMMVPYIVSLPPRVYTYKIGISDEYIHEKNTTDPNLPLFVPYVYKSQPVTLTVLESKGKLDTAPEKQPVLDVANDYSVNQSGFDLTGASVIYDSIKGNLQVKVATQGPIGEPGVINETDFRCAHNTEVINETAVIGQKEFYQVFLDTNFDGKVDLYVQVNNDTATGVTYNNGVEVAYAGEVTYTPYATVPGHDDWGGYLDIQITKANLFLPGFNDENGTNNNNKIHLMARGGSDSDFRPADELNPYYADYSGNPPLRNPNVGKFVPVEIVRDFEAVGRYFYRVEEPGLTDRLDFYMTWDKEDNFRGFVKGYLVFGFKSGYYGTVTLDKVDVSNQVRGGWTLGTELKKFIVGSDEVYAVEVSKQFDDVNTQPGNFIPHIASVQLDTPMPNQSSGLWANFRATTDGIDATKPSFNFGAEELCMTPLPIQIKDAQTLLDPKFDGYDVVMQTGELYYDEMDFTVLQGDFASIWGKGYRSQSMFKGYLGLCWMTRLDASIQPLDMPEITNDPNTRPWQLLYRDGTGKDSLFIWDDTNQYYYGYGNANRDIIHWTAGGTAMTYSSDAFVWNDLFGGQLILSQYSADFVVGGIESGRYGARLSSENIGTHTSEVAYNGTELRAIRIDGKDDTGFIFTYSGGKINKVIPCAENIDAITNMASWPNVTIDEAKLGYWAEYTYNGNYLSATIFKSASLDDDGNRLIVDDFIQRYIQDGSRFAVVDDDNKVMLNSVFSGDKVASQHAEDSPDGDYTFEYESVPTTHLQYSPGKQMTTAKKPSYYMNYIYGGLSIDTLVTDINGQTVTDQHDSMGNVTSSITPYGTSSNTGFNENGLVSHTSISASTSANQAGLRIKSATMKETTADPDIPGSSYTYTSYNKVKTVTSSTGAVTTYFYDFEEATLGDLNGDNKTDQNFGNVIRTDNPPFTDAGGNVIAGGSSYSVYDNKNRLKKTTDVTGKVTNYFYYAPAQAALPGYKEGFLWKVVEAAGMGGFETVYGYDKFGRQIWIQDPMGVKSYTEYEGVAQSRVKATVDKRGFRTEFIYDKRGRQVLSRNENKDVNGNYLTPNWLVTKPVFDEFNRQIETRVFKSEVPFTLEFAQQTDDSAYEYLVTSKTIYLADGRTDMTIDGSGNVTKYEYDAQGRQNITKGGYNPADGTYLTKTETLYDAYNRGDRSKDALNRESIAPVYDNYDRATKTTDMFSGSYGVTHYDALGRAYMTEQFDKNNVKIGGSYNYYDELGRAYKTGTFDVDNVDPVSDYIWSYSWYDFAGRVWKTTDHANQLVSSTEWYPNGRIKKTSDAIGNYIDYVKYNDNGQSLTVKNVEIHAKGTKTLKMTYTYDIAGNQLTATDNAGRVSEKKYDSLGRAAWSKDPEGVITENFYDFMGRQIKVTRDVGGLNNNREWLYNDDFTTHLTSAGVWKDKDHNGNCTEYFYDKAGRKWKTLYADATTVWSTFDAVGRVSDSTDQNFTKIVFHYNDADNTLSWKEIQRGQNVEGPTSEHFGYDAQLRKVSAGNRINSVPQHVTVWTYNKRGNVLTETQDGYTVTSTYNKWFGSRDTVTYPSGRVITHNFDQFYRLNTITQNQNPGTIATYTYESSARLDTLTFGNGAVLEPTYDNVNQVSRWLHKKASGKNWNRIADFKYVYDNAGNKKYERREFNGKIATTDAQGYGSFYNYDKLYRLTEEKKNCTIAMLDNFKANAIEPPVTGDKFNMDGVGNRTTVENQGGEISNYSFNNMNAYTNIDGIQKFQDNAGNLTNDGTKKLYYDYANRLVRVTDTSDNPIASYTFDCDGRRITKTVGTTVTRFVYDGAQCISDYDVSGTTPTLAAEYIYGNRWVDDVLLMVRGNNNFYYHRNHLGSAYAITNATTSTVESYEYSAYGQTSFYNSARQSISTTAIGNRFLYTGREYDSETGLYYYRARMYDPQTGRFLSHDPLGYVDGMGLYEYVKSSPASGGDPSGMSWYKATGYPDFQKISLGFEFEVAVKKYYSKKRSQSYAKVALDYFSARFGGLPYKFNWLVTSEIGCIDLDHFYSAASATYDAKNKDERDKLLSKMDEHDLPDGDAEDLTSNALGALFGEYVRENAPPTEPKEKALNNAGVITVLTHWFLSKATVLTGEKAQDMVNKVGDAKSKDATPYIPPEYRFPGMGDLSKAGFKLYDIGEHKNLGIDFIDKTQFPSKAKNIFCFGEIKVAQTILEVKIKSPQ